MRRAVLSFGPQSCNCATTAICALIVCCFLLGCGCAPAKIDEANGRIIFIGSDTQSYWPGAGTLSEIQPINLFGPVPLCNGPGDTILVKTQRKDLSPNSDTYHICAYNVVEDELTGSGSLKLTNPPYFTWTLQYLPSSGHYYLTGTKGRVYGIYEFDSEWRLVDSIIAPQLFPGEKQKLFAGFALSSGDIAVSCVVSGTYVSSGEAEETYFLSDGRLLDVTSDGRYALVTSDGIDYEELWQFDSHTEEMLLIERASEGIFFARFSPDQRFIAYTERSWILDGVLLYIYDRETGTTTNTWVAPNGQFLWTEK